MLGFLFHGDILLPWSLDHVTSMASAFRMERFLFFVSCGKLRNAFYRTSNKGLATFQKRVAWFVQHVFLLGLGSKCKVEIIADVFKIFESRSKF